MRDSIERQIDTSQSIWSRDKIPMLALEGTTMQPIAGEWYLSVKCDRCNCTILVSRDLNQGQGNINGEYRIRCPRCKVTEVLPIAHYQHREAKRPDICIEIL